MDETVDIEIFTDENGNFYYIDEGEKCFVVDSDIEEDIGEDLTFTFDDEQIESSFIIEKPKIINVQKEEPINNSNYNLTLCKYYIAKELVKLIVSYADDDTKVVLASINTSYKTILDKTHIWSKIYQSYVAKYNPAEEWQKSARVNMQNYKNIHPRNMLIVYALSIYTKKKFPKPIDRSLSSYVYEIYNQKLDVWHIDTAHLFWCFVDRVVLAVKEYDIYNNNVWEDDKKREEMKENVLITYEGLFHCMDQYMQEIVVYHKKRYFDEFSFIRFPISEQREPKYYSGLFNYIMMCGREKYNNYVNDKFMQAGIMHADLLYKTTSSVYALATKTLQLCN